MFILNIYRNVGGKSYFHVESENLPINYSLQKT